MCQGITIFLEYGGRTNGLGGLRILLIWGGGGSRGKYKGLFARFVNVYRSNKLFVICWPNKDYGNAGGISPYYKGCGNEVPHSDIQVELDW